MNLIYFQNKYYLNKYTYCEDEDSYLWLEVSGRKYENI